MPNQIASTKSRKSLTEHEAVLSALEEIARHEGTTAMALMRQAVRETVKKRTENSSQAKRLLPIVMQFSPKPPKRFATAAQLSRFKRNQREFDQVLLDLHLASHNGIETRNSIVPAHSKIRVLELERSHAKSQTI
ncbi:MAG TPA: hypothetical protein DCZ94_13820 [Lentisphaeria bacterium]|nr:MAG: hypothetical protein A2X48_15665 [Lentisphaerae bacterium GWF2_49_21]HBC88024.1 hypothetical protein [Lentisphaeria bacterium]